MYWYFHLILSVLGVAVLLYLADVVLQPVPIPVGGAVLFGFIAWWGLGGSVRRCVMAGALGLTVGAIVHATSHVVEDRVESVPGMVLHVAGDAAISAVVAAMILSLTIAPGRIIQCRRAHSLQTGASA